MVAVKVAVVKVIMVWAAVPKPAASLKKNK